MNEKMNFICYYKEKYNKFKKENLVHIYLEKDSKVIFKSNYSIKCINIKESRQKIFALIISFLEELHMTNNITKNDNITIIVKNEYIVKDLKNFKDISNKKYYSYQKSKEIFISHSNWKIIYNKPQNKKVKKINQKKNNGTVSKTLQGLDDDCNNIISFDLEMNYASLDDRNINETISIGAVKYSRITGKVETFYSLIKPKISYILQEKIVELTNINQDEIDNAKSFNSVMKKFSEWVGDSKSIYVSWGMADIKVLESDNLINKNKVKIVNEMIKNYVDFQCEFCSNVHSKSAIGLVNALKFCNIEFKGDLHNALDDAMNLNNLVVDFIKKEELKYEA